MITLYVQGQPVGTEADLASLLPQLLAQKLPVELRNEEGRVLGRLVPEGGEPRPPEPIVPWEPELTEADLERIRQQPGFTFDEVKRLLGWS